MLRKVRLVVALALAAACAGRVGAHELPPSFVVLDIGAHATEVELDLPLRALSHALRLPPSQLLGPQRARIEQEVSEHFALSTTDGGRYPAVVRRIAPRRTQDSRWIGNDWVVVTLHAEAPAGASTEIVTIRDDLIVRSDPMHRVLVYVRRDVRNGLIGDAPELVGEIDPEQTLVVDGSHGSWWRGFARLFTLGVEHIAAGTDHLLFLLVLLLPAPLAAAGGHWALRKGVRASLWTVAKTVSGFTIGHSVTLALGALGIVTLPARPVEVLIAVSIIASAIHAWRPLFAGRELYLAAGFGLIHGLAFATTLAGLNFDGRTLALSLLGFNLGIEAMQLIVVALVMPCLLILSRTRAYGSLRVGGALFGAIAASAWILERMLDRSNPVTLAVEILASHASWLVAGLAAWAAIALLTCLRLHTVSQPLRD